MGHSIHTGGSGCPSYLAHSGVPVSGGRSDYVAGTADTTSEHFVALFVVCLGQSRESRAATLRSELGLATSGWWTGW